MENNKNKENKINLKISYNYQKENNNSISFLSQKIENHDNILRNSPPFLSRFKTKVIYNQMEKCICKICIDNSFGTGFFCNIPFKDNSNLLPVLVTNNHVLGEKEISEGKSITIFINDEIIEREISIDKERLTYTNKEYDFTFIELKESDNLPINALEIDYEAYNFQTPEYYNKICIYLLHYPMAKKVSKSVGIINKINYNYSINHTCSSSPGSSGGPIINLNNFKVLGIHKGNHKKENYNIGIFIKRAIKIFYKGLKDANKLPLKLKDKTFLEYIEYEKVEQMEKTLNRESMIKNYNISLYFMISKYSLQIQILCSYESLFIDIESIFYKICPKYQSKDCFFLYNGEVINRFKTIKDLGIESMNVVIVHSN